MGWRRDRAREIDDEMAAHIRMAIQDRIDRGESPEDARRAVLLEFGNVQRLAEDARAVWNWTAVEQLLADARTGLKILTRSPGLSATAILLIALVIGGNATIFSAVHSLFSKPAPGITAAGLVSIGWLDEEQQIAPDSSYPDFLALRDRARSLRIAGFDEEAVTLEHPAGTHALRGVGVTDGYFEILGIVPTLGRSLSAADQSLERSGLVAVISHRLWQDHFGGAAGVVGRAIRINGHPAVIVGVAPQHFQGVWTAEVTDLWVPLLAYRRLHGSAGELDQPDATVIHGTVGRLASGATIAQARAELAAISAGLDRPASADGRDVRRVATAVPYTGMAARDNLLARRAPWFLGIFSVVTLLTLLVVCANVANLMLARAMTRQREMAVRQSFGASRLRIIRIVVAEGLVLALAAWGMACLFAVWTSSVLPRLIPPSEFGHVRVLLDFSPDWVVLAYAMVLAIVATLIFTIAPAVRTWRQDLLSFLKAGEQGVVEGRSRVSQALVVLQLAFSVLLVSGGLLAWRSLSLIEHADLGFRTDNLMVVTIDTTARAQAPGAHAALLDAMLERIRALPGVEGAAHARQSPNYSWQRVAVQVSGRETPVSAERNEVSPGFLSTHGVPLVAGREPARRVDDGPVEVIVNQHLAEALWPGAPAVGQRLRVGERGPEAIVAGIAANARVGGFRREPRPRLLLVPTGSSSAAGVATFVVRYAGSLERMAPAVTSALRETDAAVPVLATRTMDAELDDMTWMNRTLTVLLVLFAGASLLIASLGQYAAMAFATRRRTRDFGIRIALGASREHIMRSALGDGLRLTAIGLAVGLALGVVAARAGQSLLYGVTPADPLALVGVVTVLGLTSLAACYLPARRAGQVDAMRTLRQD